MKSIDEFLGELRREGVHVWCDGDDLRCRAPKGRLTPDLRDQITRRKSEILDALGSHTNGRPESNGTIPRTAREMDLPVSAAQQRLWFLDQYESDKSVYVIPAAVRLAGELHLRALSESINQIVQRHEVMRTTFPAKDGRPIQRILPRMRVEVPVFDLPAAHPGQQLELIRNVAAEETARPFDLAAGPLFRVKLLRLAADDHVLLLTTHHIISDAWSVGVFVGEFSELYSAACSSRPPALPELSIQYADFAAWQNERLGLGLYDEQLEFWKTQLRAAPPLLELPCDRPRPTTQTHRGRVERFQFSETLTAKLKEFTQQSRGSLYMTLLTGFSALLGRYSSQDEVVVGSPIANRNHPQTEPLIGFFVNTLAMRVDLSDDPSFHDLMAQVKQVALDAYAHQDIPFEDLVVKIQPERSGSYMPLFQVMLAVQNTPISELALPGLTVSPLELACDTAKFDLTLIVDDQGSRLSGSLEYNTDLFEAATIRRMAGHLENLLEAMTRDPGQRISAVDFLSAEEVELLLHTWNATESDFPRDQCIQELFDRQAAETPAATALVFLDQQVTYAELNARANQLARHLRQLGVGPEVAVPIICERSIELIVGILGIVKAGGAYVPLDPKYPLDRLEYMFGEVQSPVVLTHRACADRLPQDGTERLLLDDDWHRIAKQSSDNLEHQTKPDNLAYVIFTSGSTGRPKGVRVVHDGVVRLVKNINYASLSADEVILQLTPISFDVSTFEVWGSLLNGGRLVIPPPEIPTFQEIGRFIKDYGITTMWLTSGLFHLMVDENLEGLRPLRQLFSGGDVLSVPHCRRVLREIPSLRLINGYGPTECTTFTTCCTLSEETIGNSVSIGRPVSNTKVYILDKHRKLVPPGCPGELCAGGYGLARDYLNDPQLTAEKFIDDPFDLTPGARLYRIGDLCRYLPDGNIEYLGRFDRQVKIRGFRIELGEIETVLLSHEAVRDCAVTARPDASGNKQLVAYLVASDPDHMPHEDDLRAELGERLPDYMLPSAIVVLDHLPLNPNGKVDRNALPDPQEFFGEQDYVAPRTDTEQALAEIWSQLLKVPQISVHDDFFAVGGHSLLAIQMISRIRDRFDIELPVRQVFESPTIAELAERLDLRRQDAESQTHLPPIQRLQHDGPLSVSYAQERLWFLEQLEPGNAFYNMPFAFRCTGRLDVAVLQRSINEVIRRHASLRTTFHASNGKPIQRVHEHLEIKLERQSLSQLDPPQRDEEVRRLALQEASQPFCLERGPLIRTTLLELAEGDCVLLLTIHHIVADGWSMGVLVREFSEIYPALLRGESSPLPDLEIQYADFAAWQRAWLHGERLQSEIDYWLGQLDGAPQVLEISADHSRPPVQTFRGGSQPFQLDAATTDRLKSLSNEAGASLFMTLLAGFATLLHRFTGRDDLLIGSPTANRNHHAIEGLIGFFVNTLALRMDLSGDPSFSELLARVRQTTLDAFAHQDVPFEYLVEKLQPARDMSRNPLVQVSFIFQNSPFTAAELDDLTLRQMEAETGTARFDVEFFLWEENGGLRGACAYYTDLFEAETIARFVGHFETLLAGISADSDRRVSELPILTEDERRLLLVDWNATAAAYPRDRCVHELFEQQASRHPDRVAVACGGQSLTYRELDGRANQLARHLQTLGAGPDVLVGLCLPRSIDLVVGLLGVLKAGAAYVPLDASYPRDRLAFMIEDAGLAILLTHATLPPRLPEHAAKTLCLDSDWEQIAEQSPRKAEANIGPRDLVYVIYTSGSTGRPKGALLEHRNVVNYLAWASRNYEVAQGAGAPVNSSIGFDATVTSLITPLVAGRCVELLPEQNEIDHLCAALQSERDFSLAKITPAHLEVLGRLLPAAPLTGRIRALIIGGEALTASHLDYWRRFAPHVRLVNEYGPTETVVGCCVYDVPRNGELSQNVPIGRPIANTQLYVLDAKFNPVPVGVPGELYIGGAGVGRGYLNRDDLTAERFLADPFSPYAGARLYRTGDGARYLPDGNLEFLGRLDSQIKLRGYRIELGEIERVLAEHPAVDNVVVMLRQDPPGDDRLVAYAVLRETTPNPVANAEVTAADVAVEQVTQWEHVFQDSYASSQTTDDPTFDIAGWNSSYTGAPIPAEEMREWVDQTVHRIRSYGPRRMWEIGCGTGLLLSRLAPHAESYLGTDFSAAALGRVQQMIDRGDRLRNASLLCREADDAAEIEGPFDAIVLNSVVQYFPDVAYLLSVLDKAVERLAAGGRIFLGDVRSLPLLETFHTSVETYRALDSSPAAELKQRIRERMSREEELLLDPQFFFALKSRYPGLTHVEVTPKRGRCHNELLRFRFDASLHFGPAASDPAEIPWREWEDDRLSLSRLKEVLDGGRPEMYAVRHVPSARLRDDVLAVGTLRAASSTLTARQLRQQISAADAAGVDPEHLWAMGEEFAYRVDIAVSDDAACFDVVFRRQTDEVSATRPIAMQSFNGLPKPWHLYANNPLRARLSQRLAPELRQLAESKLPEYMVPSAFVVLQELPLTANGKVDHKALPAPAGRPATAAETLVPPRTPEEEVLAAIWADVLGLELVGTHDDFFSLGGHSLLATQVISRVRDAFAVELQVRTIFEAPTVASLAERIAALREATFNAPAATPIEPRQRPDLIPLSFAQERLWFLDRMEEKSPAYNIASAIRLTGPLDVDALRRSFQELVNRHEALRTTFPTTVDGEPLQRIAAALDFELPIIDVEHLDEDAQLAEIHAAAADVHEQGFDLQRGPLLRATLARRNGHDHVLLACMHHIVSDGWSMGVLVREIAEFYTSFVEDRPHRLAPLPVQYADYSIWQRDWLRGEVLQSQIAYWREQLAAAPPVLELPTDYPRPAVQNFQGAIEVFELEPALTAALQDLSRRQGVSLFMTLLSAFAVLLSRYSREKDIVIGSPIAGRRNREIESLVGFFVNTLALRIDLEGNPAFAELLARVRKLSLDAYAHQDAPFEQLVEELQPQRSLSHAPIFQVMFILLNTPWERIDLAGLTMTPMASNSSTAKFDLTLCFGEGERGLWGWFEYRSDLFTSTTVRRMIGHLTALLKAVVADPASPVDRLPLITSGERQQVVIDWNETGRTAEPFSAVQRRFEEQVEATPEQTAVEFEGQSLTFRELNGRANALAHRLVELGVGPDARVGICLDRGVEMVTSVLSVLKAGGAYVPLDPQYPHERLALMLEDAEVDVLLTQTKLLATIPRPSAPVIVVDDDATSVSDDRCENLAVQVDADHLAYIIYTSGSTGQPKGIAMRHGALANLIRWHRAVEPGFGPARTLQFTSLSFDVSFQEIFSTWCSGGTLVLVDDATRRDSRALVRYLGEHQIERLFLPFIALQQLALSAIEQDVTRLPLRDLITAGEQLRITPELSELMRRLPQCRLHNHYGPAESHVVTAFTLPGDVETWPELPPIGRPIANSQIYILDDHRQPVPPGVPGELYVGGECLARGYWRRPELSQLRFIRNPLATEGHARLYRTGDLARYLHDGNIEFLGRCDDQVKIRGFRVEPGEIEACLAKSSAVSDVVVVAREDSPGNRRLVAYVVPQPESTVGESELRDFVRASLPDYMVPAAFVLMESFPLTPSGKVNRRGLLAPAADAGTSSNYVPPRSLDELRIAEIWESVLDRHAVGVKDDFFELGGHSLLAVRVMARIEREFGVHLPLSVLFRDSTVERLTRHLRDPGPSQTACLIPIHAHGSRPPFFCVPGAGGNVFYLADLARRLGPDQPFYGLQAPGLDGASRTADGIEEIATHYLREIQLVQPTGPYYLGGHSFGGQVAFELARQLQDGGDEVGLLVIFDTNAPHTIEHADSVDDHDEARWLCDIAVVLEHLTGREQQVSYDDLQALAPDEQLAYFRDKIIRGGWLPEETTPSQVRAFVDVYKANVRAVYEPPNAVTCPIALFHAEQAMSAEETSDGHSKAALIASGWGWKDLTSQDVDVQATPGNHITMLTEPHVNALAEKLGETLARYHRAAAEPQQFQELYK